MGTDKKKFIGLAKSMKQLDFSGKLADIQCDSLIVCGEKDFANKRASRHLSKYIKGARSVIIQDAGHELNKDSASKLSVIITDFWNNNDHKTKRQCFNLTNPLQRKIAPLFSRWVRAIFLRLDTANPLSRMGIYHTTFSQ
ncbi:alpha/beta fold hydrolase [Lentibacillus sp. CBA3610]|uniref:alpha/beta fold hydrolase n=1 Tax=Lentibacillus sp. CBA3610 TaxID=2518176 RepID=UPI001595F02F|nr:hypothetical protein [Lentibacillus sp. CBA3610]QKY71234.1 hypothetical protein Len3610_18265 [Lentibacillus sp. CBA3610]